MDAQPVIIAAAVLDVGDDLALVVPPRAGRRIMGVEARSRADGVELAWICADAQRERLRLDAVPLDVLRRLWFLLQTEGVPVFEASGQAGKPLNMLAVLWSDRVAVEAQTSSDGGSP